MLDRGLRALVKIKLTNYSNTLKTQCRQCLISFRIHVENIENTWEVHSKIINKNIGNHEHSSESHPNFTPVVFAAPNLTQVGSGTLGVIRGRGLLALFGRRCRSKDRRWDPRKITNRSKIALLSTGWHLDPRQIVSGRRFGKTLSFYEKSMRKSKAFDGSEPSSLITHFSHFRKNKQMYAKRIPKVELFDPKTNLGRSRVDWLCHFGRFLRIRKIIHIKRIIEMWKHRSKGRPNHFTGGGTPGGTPPQFLEAVGWTIRRLTRDTSGRS